MPGPTTILGQDEALDVIHGALAAGRLHHAWIFSGPVGVGKFTAAMEVARILLDPAAAPGLDGRLAPDPESAASALIDAGSHPDLHVIYKELALYSDNRALRERKLLNIPLDLLRERMLGGRTADDRVHESVAYRTPARGHRKVFIIDEAELIDATGQNALLKTLEEPPPNTFIFLITAEAKRLLPTIRSRCQHVAFVPLDDAALDAWFARTDLDVPPEERAWIRRFCDGSPGTALVAARYGFARWQETIAQPLERLRRGEYPAGFGETLAALADEFAVAWVKNHDNASKDAANKAGARHVLRLLASHARDEVRASLDRAQPSPWLEVIDLLRDAERHLAGNVNMKHVFENLVVQWAQVNASGRHGIQAVSGAP